LKAVPCSPRLSEPRVEQKDQQRDRRIGDVQQGKQGARECPDPVRIPVRQRPVEDPGQSRHQRHGDKRVVLEIAEAEQQPDGTERGESDRQPFRPALKESYRAEHHDQDAGHADQIGSGHLGRGGRLLHPGDPQNRVVHPGEDGGSGQPPGHRGVLDDVSGDELGVAVALHRDELGEDVEQSEETETEPEYLPETPSPEPLLACQVEAQRHPQADPETEITGGAATQVV
jgi:hypothetical protein